ncbi:MAG: hypothetical protein NTY16_09095 [Deltaproteobacteria bacterium]|nr:hypothetical protein [Deltaproteobacteria bacterium]
MKRAELIFLLLILLTLTGCATVDDLKGSVTSRVASITSNVDPALVAKVPGDKRGEFPKAEFSITVAHEKLKLANMAAIKRQIADLTEKIKAQEEKIKSLKMEKTTTEKEAKVSAGKIK